MGSNHGSPHFAMSRLVRFETFKFSIYSKLSCDSEPDSHVILYWPLENGPSSIIGIHVANSQCQHFVGLSHGVNGVTIHVPESLQIGTVSVGGWKQGLQDLDQWFVYYDYFLYFTPDLTSTNNFFTRYNCVIALIWSHRILSFKWLLVNDKF